MKAVLLGSLLVSFSITQGQIKPGNNISGWSKSIVNLECRPHQATTKENATALTGTALYVTDGSRKYLITARHVVYDEWGTKQNMINSGDTGSHMPSFALIYDISIRTPYTAYLQRKRNNADGWASSEKNSLSYILSSEREDIAVISLQADGFENIARTLDEDGYVPLALNKIDTSCTIDYGDDVFTIGYPFYYSMITRYQNKPDTAYPCQSPDVVMPVLVYGKVSMNHLRLNYFIADIDAYPGNSGGPIIRNDMVVGIVSSQIPLPIMSGIPSDSVRVRSSQLYSRGNLVKIVKPSQVMYYIRLLQERE